VKTTVEDKGAWQKAISITLEPEEVDVHVDQLVAKYRKKANVPGFRAGHVPEQMVRSAYRENIESDLLQAILPEATEKAIREHELNVATTPRIEDLRFRPGEPLSFTAVVDLWPTVEVEGLEGIEVEEEVLEVDEEAIDEFLAVLRDRAAEIRPVSRPSKEGDILEVTIQGVDQQGGRLPRAKRQDLRMEAGGQTLLPEFRAATVGIEPGETKVVRVHYPADFGDKELAGQQRYYRLKVRQIGEKVLPALDDAFAQLVDGSPDLETLRTRVRLRLEGEERLSARRGTEEKVVDRLIQLNPFDVPQGILDRSLESGLERARQDDPGVDPEHFRVALMPGVVRMWKRQILLDSITRKESIEVTDEEMEERLKEISGGGDPRRARKQLELKGELDRFRKDLLERKTLEQVLEKVTIQRFQKPRHRKKQSNIIIP
jgi:trigger factor